MQNAKTASADSAAPVVPFSPQVKAKPVKSAEPKAGEKENTAKVVAVKVKKYTFTVNDTVTEGIAPQARHILNNVESGKAYTEAEVKRRMQELADEGILTTRQEPMRILAYYRGAMIQRGYLLVTVE